MVERYVGYVYLALAALGYAYTIRKSRAKAGKAAQSGLKAFKGVIVTLLSVFALVGLLEVYVPPEFITRTLGAQAGISSLFVAAAMGSVAAGPPIAAYPIAQSLLNGGAWTAAVAAFIVSWTLVGFVSLPFEARTFGTRFAVARNVLSFIFAIIIGVLMGWIL